MAKKRMPATKDDDAEMTAKAAEAFAMYIAMGPSRSLTNLAYILVEQNQYKTSTTARGILAAWSKKYHWQSRIAAAATAKGEESQGKALEWGDSAFLRTAEELAKVLAELEPGNVALKMPYIDAVIKIRESVRRREPRGAQANVNVNVGFAVALRDAVNAIAAEEGLDPEEVLARAERIVADHQR